MALKRWSELSNRQQTAILTLASIQVSLAATACADLAVRKPELVNGSKSKWAAVIAVSFVGPVLYFVRGRRAPRGRG